MTAWRAIRIGLILVVGAPAAAASALEPPEILYQEGVSETEPMSPWLPLDGARINSLGFILGTRAQAKPASDSAVYYKPTVLTVADGHPDQPSPLTPTSPCVSAARTPGTEFVLAIGRYEGPGTYTLRVEANLPSNGASSSSCSGGPASTATFTIDPAVAMDVLATGPTLVPSDSLSELAKIRSIPAGGAGETQCARDGVVGPDGSITGPDLTPLLGFAVVFREIRFAGRWTCVGRAREALTQAPDGDHYTRWSAPVSFDAISTFQTARTLVDRRPKRFTVAYGEMPPGSEGGTVTLRITRGKGCPRVRAKTLRARVGASLRVRFTFTLPEKDKANLLRSRKGVDSYGWNFKLSFSGTKLVRAATATEGAFVTPKRFTTGHNLGFPGIERAYCTRTA